MPASSRRSVRWAAARRPVCSRSGRRDPTVASRIGDSDGARRLATSLRNGSYGLQDAAAALRRSMANSTSRSGFNSAEGSGESSSGDASRRLSERMDDLSSVLRNHADWVEATEQELRSLEWRIRNWATAHPAAGDPLDATPNASLIRYWPYHLSFEWRDLNARLRAYGVYV